MLLQQEFWEIKFIDILNFFTGIIGAVIAVIFTYFLYKKLDKIKEKNRVRALFLRIRDILESLMVTDQERKRFFNAELPYLRHQGDELIKVGVIVDNIDERRIKGNIRDNNIDLKVKSTIPILWILDKYLIAGAEIQNLITKQNIEKNKENANSILKEMRDFAKEYHGIKLNDKDSTLD